MTIDEVVLASRIKAHRTEALLVDVGIANGLANLDKDMARLDRDRVRLDRLIAQIEADELALYWVRMAELLHTPCWRYRVAA